MIDNKVWGKKILAELKSADKARQKDPGSSIRYLHEAITYARSYEGIDRESYFKKIEQRLNYLSKLEGQLDESDKHHLANAKTLLGQSREGKMGIERRVLGIVNMVLIVGGLFFLSSNITGNAISSVSQNSSNWIGGILLVAGIIGASLYFKKK